MSKVCGQRAKIESCMAHGEQVRYQSNVNWVLLQASTSLEQCGVETLPMKMAV